MFFLNLPVLDNDLFLGAATGFMSFVTGAELTTLLKRTFIYKRIHDVGAVYFTNHVTAVYTI